MYSQIFSTIAQPVCLTFIMITAKASLKEAWENEENVALVNWLPTYWLCGKKAVYKH